MNKNGKINYTTLWYECRQSTIKTMVSNLNADIQAGYNWLGKSIQMQLFEITKYTLEYQQQFEALSYMTHEEAVKWCKKDMIKRGDME